MSERRDRKPGVSGAFGFSNQTGGVNMKNKGGWAGTCTECRHSTTKKMKDGRKSNYCEFEDSFMTGKFKRSLEATKRCFEPTKGDDDSE